MLDRDWVASSMAWRFDADIRAGFLPVVRESRASLRAGGVTYPWGGVAVCDPVTRVIVSAHRPILSIHFSFF